MEILNLRANLSGVVAVLSVLAQDTRFQAFRMLVERGPDGLPAGQLAAALGVPPSSLTFHLQQLRHAEGGWGRCMAAWWT